MHGHVRKRHKPHCATRSGARRCNCDGSWQARMRPARRNTAKIERTFRTKQEAEDWLVAQRSSILQGTFVADPRAAERPFAEVVAAWRESWPNRLSPRRPRATGRSSTSTYYPEFERPSAASRMRSCSGTSMAWLPTRGSRRGLCAPCTASCVTQ